MDLVKDPNAAGPLTRSTSLISNLDKALAWAKQILSSRFNGFDGSEEAVPKGIKASWFGDFVAIEVRHIEHVHDLVQVRADFGDLQIQPKIK